MNSLNNRTEGENMDSTKHDPRLITTIPQNIIQCAQEIQIWMDLNGHKDWELFGMADRRLVDKLRDGMKSVGTEWSKLLREGKIWETTPELRDALSRLSGEVNVTQ